MKKLTLLLLSILTFSCNQNDSLKPNRIKNIGDIPFNESTDLINFEVCYENNIKQYYVRKSSDTQSSYKGEKKGLENAILKKYKFPKTEKENGYVTIRFIINCKGESGRFRIEEMDFDYKGYHFDKGITDQLLEIVRNLNEWIPRKNGERSYDIYQYLTFKIKEGQVKEILP